MGTDSIDFLQGLDVPHLRKMHSSNQQKDDNRTLMGHTNIILNYTS